MYTEGFKGKRMYKRNGNGYSRKKTVYRGNGNNYKWAQMQRDIRTLKAKTSAMEYKFSDNEANQIPVLSGGSIEDQIFIIFTGDTDQNRDGRKITITSIQIRFQIELPSNLNFNDTKDLVRIICLHDKQANEALPGVAEILVTADIQSHRQLDLTHRFRTLMDKTFQVKSRSGAFNGSVTHWGGDIVNYEWYKKLDIPIIYSGDGGDVDDITSNNIILFYISEAQLAGVKANVRVRYLDT